MNKPFSSPPPPPLLVSWRAIMKPFARQVKKYAGKETGPGKIAFVMASHARLGQESRWTDLDSNVMEMIFKFSLLDWKAENDEGKLKIVNAWCRPLECLWADLGMQKRWVSHYYWE